MNLWAPIISIAIAAFSLGFFTHAALSENVEPNTLNPEMLDTPAVPKNNSAKDIISIILGAQSPERISPQDWIKEQQIHVYNDKVILDIQNPEWAAFADTNSMDPVLDEQANAIEIVPSSPDQLQIGDIASYKDGDDTIIHRIIGKGKDDNGVFFIMKGDNNPEKDPGKIRFSQIQRMVVAIIY